MTNEDAIFVLSCVEAHGLAEEARKMAIEALKAEPVKHGRWIPVTERLPELGEKVLVSTKYTVFTQVFKRIYGTPDRWRWEHNTIKKVIAWMPLPELYKENEVEE